MGKKSKGKKAVEVPGDPANGDGDKVGEPKPAAKAVLEVGAGRAEDLGHR